jgi:hypothetical protein
VLLLEIGKRKKSDNKVAKKQAQNKDFLYNLTFYLMDNYKQEV